MNSQIFEQINSIVFKETEHLLSSVKPQAKNLELRFMVLRKIDQQILKVNRKKITKYWIADKSGSAFLNVYDLDDNVIRQGDVYYLSGAYAQLFKGMMNIHQGKHGLFKKINEFQFQINVQPNYSLKPWEEQMNPNEL